MIDRLADELRRLDPACESYATRFVDRLLDEAVHQRASDLHLQPGPAGLEIRWRFDGVLRTLGVFSPGTVADVVTRLKVLAGLLTYRRDVPQEGRLREPRGSVELRVSSFPSLHGERAVVRLFGGETAHRYLDDLSFPEPTHGALREVLGETSGALLISGPAGSGKTTTAYACLREIVRESEQGKCVVTLEDPIEAVVAGAAQAQIDSAAGFDFATGLRSLVRQDPEVILVGEIRDVPTAETALQAALTGHLVLSTFHAGSAAGAISRLREMGIEPYVLRSGVLGILNQRLVRRLCTCAAAVTAPTALDRLGLDVAALWEAAGCERCQQRGFRGRVPVAEWLSVDSGPVVAAILAGCDAQELERAAVTAGMRTRWHAAADLVGTGTTTPREVRRVLGLRGG